ncbi:MAG: chitobiase/beta-hexosaminidase C-terminal domain-containing protein [Bacteroidales bacterium]|nr:chitobiase/beta-hexosaminidase C-terminal domain-containing protein [Bacteroidales bacterium]
MKKILLFLAVLFSLTINGQEHRAHIFINLSDTLCQDSSHIEVIDKLNVGIIPMPKLVTQFDSFDGLEYFVLDNTCMLIDSEDEEISRIVNVLRKDINDITGMDLNVSKKTNKKNKPIHFSLYTPERIEEMSKSRKTDIIGLGIGPNLDSIPGRKPNPQEYVISISSNGIIISAPTHQGLFYGAQSLKQLIRHQILTENNLEIPCYYIFDLPSLEYRGWMDDISRGPIPTMEFIKEEIRRLAEYKFNFFNLYTEHLFKLENYPDIAPTDGLTAEEIKELTEFAKDYYIEFIGNQQCFAHAEKTLDNPFYDDIKDTRFNFNPGVEETYEFLEELLGETAQAYESKYFNINCDETEGLGNGKAKSYVENVGAETAYCQHINKVYEILQKYDKDVMMWGDIIAKNPEMINQLPEDIQFIVWSYGGRDSFDEMIEPFKNSGHEFWVAPGASCWASSFPYIDNYTKNIANFNRDAAKNGAKGVINTAWDDYGETMFNSTWHAMIWCAETSWNTLLTNDENERLKREKVFNENFNVQYFNVNGQQPTANSRDVSTTPNNVEDMSLLRLTNKQTAKDYMSNLYELNKLIDESDMRNVMNFQTLNEPLLEFFESQVDSAASAKNTYFKNKSFEIYQNLLKDRSELETNTEIIDMGILASYRAYVTTLKNELKIQLYNTLQNPTDENVNISKQMSEQLLDSLHLLKKRFVNAWNMESRSYYRNVFTERYDKIAKDILNAGNYVYIQTIDNGQQTTVTLKTLFNDRPIYYTTDGSTPDKNSDIYAEPIKINRSCIVKAICFEDNRDVIVNEKYILYHKGMGSFKKLNTVAGNYRPEYSGGGENALLNGIVGSDNYKDGNWQGFYGTDCDIELDFGKKEVLNSLKINFITNPYDWILMPDVLKVYTSTNGIDYKLFNTYGIGNEVDKTKATIVTCNIDLSGLSSRYVRIVVETPGLIPEGLPGYNNPSWMFLDEIIVR